MRRRHIAIKPTSKQWSFAVAAGDSTEATLLKTGTFVRDSERTLSDQLGEVFEPLQVTDRLACALPAQDSLLRWLEFPFSEPRKIAAAVLPEMTCQIPDNLDNRTVFHEVQCTGKVLTAAVLTEQIKDLLSQFDDNREPLGYIGLSPFCYASGLEYPVDSLFLCCDEKEITLTRITDGAVTDLRILPRTSDMTDNDIVRQASMLSRGRDVPLFRLRSLGIASDGPLANSLEQAGFEIEPVQLDTENLQVPDELTGVACLALTAAKANSSNLNLRSGPYKLKNDWQALKRRAWLASGLLLLSLLIVSGSGYLQYQQRTTELKKIHRMMASRYQKQFPGEKLHVAAPLQLQSKLKALQKKVAQFGTDAPEALQVLLAISKKIDAGLKLDIREYVQNDEGLRLTGSTESFDAVSRILASLQQEILFKEVRILDSKQAIDGSRVDFQLQIHLVKTKGE